MHSTTETTLVTTVKPLTCTFTILYIRTSGLTIILCRPLAGLTALYLGALLLNNRICNSPSNANTIHWKPWCFLHCVITSAHWVCLKYTHMWSWVKAWEWGYTLLTYLPRKTSRPRTRPSIHSKSYLKIENTQWKPINRTPQHMCVLISKVPFKRGST